MPITVEELTKAHDKEITAFLDGLGAMTPSVLGYHYPFYRDMLVKIGVGQPVYFAARLDGELVGYLPAFSRQSEAGVVYCSLPFFGPNAGVLCSDEPARAEVHQALLRALLDRADRDEALSCSVYTPFMFDEFDLYDEIMPDAVVTEKFTQYLDLTTTAWGSSIRYDLRKADRLGVEVSTELTSERFETFYSIYRQNCEDYGIPLKPRRCLELLVDHQVLGRHTGVYFAHHEGAMIGGLLMIWAPLTASYYVPCLLASARTLQPNTVLIHRAAEDARGRGIRLWNWESSPSRESGVFKFKKKWGGQEGRYRIYTKVFRPQEEFAAMGKDGIAEAFPFYYVYPFDRL